MTAARVSFSRGEDFPSNFIRTKSLYSELPFTRILSIKLSLSVYKDTSFLKCDTVYKDTLNKVWVGFTVIFEHFLPLSVVVGFWL